MAHKVLILECKIMQKGIKKEAPILGVKTLASEVTNYLVKMIPSHC
jgi:hypothetical protein